MNKTSSNNKIALAAVCLSAVMLGLEITSIPSVLPTIKSVLSAEFKQLQWIMNAYTLAMCSSLVAMGALADIFGRKRIFTIGIMMFSITSLICGLADNASILIAARFFQGVSAAAMLACQVAVLSNQFKDGAQRGQAFAIWGMTFGLGLGFGPIVGGSIVTLLSWEWVFLIHVLIGILTLTLAYKGVEESADPQANSIDLGGMLTLSLSVFGFVYLITQGEAIELGNITGISILVASIVSLLLFVFIEKRVTRPMFDFNAFRIRNFSGALLGAGGMNFSFWPFVIYFPIYLQSVLDYSIIMAGLTVLALTIPTFLIPPFAERLLLKRGPGFVIPLGLFTIASGFVLLWLVYASEQASWMTLLPGCVLAGLGLGLTNTPVTNTATGALPPERAGMASGMEFSARMISLALNIAIMGFVLVKGISIGLMGALAQKLETDELSLLADVIAAGNFIEAEIQGVALPIARDAFMQGFSWLLLYGAVAAFLLGLMAKLVFAKHSQSFVEELKEGTQVTT